METGNEVKIIHIKETDSTNEEVFRLKDKYKIPFFVVADIQTSGRGRYGRVWESPEGGLWMTGLFKKRNNKDGFKFMFGSAVVVYKELKTLGVNARIKFPNDIYVGDKKICGILVEEREGFLAVGIGLNVNQNRPPVEGSTSIYIITGVLHDKIALAYNIGKGLMEVDRKNFSDVFKEYRNLLDTLGKYVRVYTPSDMYEGIFEDLTENLEVILRGEFINIIPAGEVFHLEENYERGY
ncbi:MAG: biotin--[acetyl-CoA-carboxylase] ligase [candidate division WOR-3 bacterium]